jgi:hypothetical protein
MSNGGESVPVLVVEVSGAPGGVAGVAGVGGVVDRIERACRSGSRFAVLIDARRAGGEMAGRDRRALLGRLRALRGELTARCAGVVFLTAPADGGEADGDGRRLRAARLLFGCPVQAVRSVAAARDWLEARGATVPEGIEP